MSAASSSRRFFKAFGVIVGVLGLFFLAQIIAVFFLALVLGSAGWSEGRISDWLTDNTTGQFATILLVEAATIFGVWLILKYTKRSWPAIRLGRRFSGADAVSAISGFAIYFGLSFAANLLVSVFVPAIDLEQAQQIGFESVTGLPLVLVFMALCVAVPIGEEVLFRGLLYRGLKRLISFWPAAVLTCLLFGAAHLEFFGDNPLHWAAAIDTAVFSAVLIWVYEKRGNLWAPIVLHSFKNAIAFIFLFVL